MSIKLMAAIWDNADPRLNGTRLVILLCLADHANDDGECWPSLQRIAQRARVEPRNVMLHLKTLVDLRYVTITRSAGRRNRYKRGAPDPHRKRRTG